MWQRKYTICQFFQVTQMRILRNESGSCFSSAVLFSLSDPPSLSMSQFHPDFGVAGNDLMADCSHINQWATKVLYELACGAGGGKVDPQNDQHLQDTYKTCFWHIIWPAKSLPTKGGFSRPWSASLDECKCIFNTLYNPSCFRLQQKNLNCLTGCFFCFLKIIML